MVLMGYVTLMAIVGAVLLSEVVTHLRHRHRPLRRGRP